MKRKLLFILATASMGLNLHGQTSAVQTLKMEKAGDAYCSPVIQIPLTAEVNTPTADLKWKGVVSHKMMESEPLEPNHEQLEQIRNELFLKKLALDRERMSTGGYVPSPTAVTPKVGVNYTANKNDGWNPLDNNIAISNKGIIMSVSNDVVEIDDSTGHNLYYQTLNTFIPDAAIPNACDPVVVYDKGADRFIFYCQEVTSGSGANHMLVFFSKTNNPATGGWNYFKLTGDPLGTGDMADYPKVGISNNDVFISSNLFNNGSYDQSIVVQIGKAQGYAGGTLNTKVWTNIAGSPFTLLPVSEGQGNSYGPGIWMVSTQNGGGSSFDLYKISNDVTASPTMAHYSVNTTTYGAPGNSSQKGTTEAIMVTDCRALSGFYLNGILHFVFASADATNTYNAVNYNRINVSNQTNTNKIFSTSGTDCAYPSIASYTALGVTGDQSVMIGFAQSSSSIFPQISAVSYDNSMSPGTVTVVKAGTTYVSVSGGSGQSRWGDYSGMCRRHNSPQACCWMAGSIANSSNSWDAYVAQIYDPSFATGIQQPQTVLATNLKTYPNPVMDMFKVDFTLDRNSEKTNVAVYDMQGRMVRELFSGYCQEGENTFSFNKANLSQGTYLLVITAGEDKIMHEKIVVAD
ncbi:MAG: T9SS type A sorting domain-containing protein [Bacteroidia bacterium]